MAVRNGVFHNLFLRGSTGSSETRQQKVGFGINLRYLILCCLIRDLAHTPCARSTSYARRRELREAASTSLFLPKGNHKQQLEPRSLCHLMVSESDIPYGFSGSKLSCQFNSSPSGSSREASLSLIMDITWSDIVIFWCFPFPRGQCLLATVALPPSSNPAMLHLFWPLSFLLLFLSFLLWIDTLPLDQSASFRARFLHGKVSISPQL